jgi:hypothetical protein
VDAKRIQNTVHYKSERTLPFRIFLGKLQNMFAILKDVGEGEELTQRTKVDDLLSKTQHPSLSKGACAVAFQG